MQSSPIVAMVWRGPDVIAQARKLIGATHPLQADIGTIRGDYGIVCERNLVHASDSLHAAEKEINLWFKSNELFLYDDNTN
jgi:nucleoside-diphosphate kinase